MRSKYISSDNVASAKTLFIDTNILLSFYHLTSEDLEELRKLIALVGSKRIELVLTQQIKDEFKRNRSAKIADALKRRELR
jgi:predicted nucleic acid-binding protein